MEITASDVYEFLADLDHDALDVIGADSMLSSRPGSPSLSLPHVNPWNPAVSQHPALCSTPNKSGAQQLSNQLLLLQQHELKQQPVICVICESEDTSMVRSQRCNLPAAGESSARRRREGGVGSPHPRDPWDRAMEVSRIHKLHSSDFALPSYSPRQVRATLPRRPSLVHGQRCDC